MSKILLGISSSIAFYKAFTLYKKLLENGFEVKVVLTKGVQKMIQTENNNLRNFDKISDININQNGDLEFESLVLKKGREVFYDLFEEGVCWQEYLNNQRPIVHIDWADWADLILIAPATANVIGKIANGIYDDLLTNIVCSTAAPVWLAPAMNVKMWQNSIVRENVQKLQKHAFTLIPPEEGSLACGYNGVGRLAKVDIILKKVMAKFGVGEDVLISQKIDNSSNLHNSSTDENFLDKTVLITAGPTTEKLDPIRVITNQSSGKTGLSLAKEFLKKGFKVILLASKNIDSAVYLDYFGNIPPTPLKGGNTPLIPLQKHTPPLCGDYLQRGKASPNLTLEHFTDYESLQKLLFEKISAADICIHLAAVSDFIPAKSYNQKINSDENLELKLVRTKKLLDQIKKINKNCFLVGFKLETKEKEILEELKKTIIRSQSDMMVGNYQTKTTGTDGDNNEFWIMDKNFKTQKLDFGSKNDLAKKLVEIVFSCNL